MGTRIKDRLEDAFDVNFDVSEIKIDTFDDFGRVLLEPYNGGEKLYYRGERIKSRTRRLIPTLLRNEDVIEEMNGGSIFNIDSKKLFDFYCSRKHFISVYKTLYGEPSKDSMYYMTAFAQHYLDISPFVDFTKCIYVALSFAIKGRETADSDIVIYTAEDIGDDDTSSDMNEVNTWLGNYNVNIVNTDFREETIKYFTEKRKNRGFMPKLSLREEFKKLEELCSSMSPVAKLIDIPTNDLMKYQQGVFLLLNNFSLVDSMYLTKSVRRGFVIKKYIINGALCGELKRYLAANAPQYRYKCLMNIAEAVK